MIMSLVARPSQDEPSGVCGVSFAHRDKLLNHPPTEGPTATDEGESVWIDITQVVLGGLITTTSLWIEFNRLSAPKGTRLISLGQSARQESQDRRPPGTRVAKALLAGEPSENTSVGEILPTAGGLIVPAFVECDMCIPLSHSPDPPLLELYLRAHSKRP